MRIATFNLPTLLNDGTSAERQHAKFGGTLLEMFGGFTAWEAEGAWRSNNGVVFAEPVRVYQIAYSDDPDFQAVPALQGLAKLFKADAQQEAVFLTIDGEAQFV